MFRKIQIFDDIARKGFSMIIVLLGAPGAGKGTIAGKLEVILNIPTISTGDILRKEVNRNTVLGNEVKRYLLSGELVPDQLIIKIVENRIIQKDCKQGFIFDGFPRTLQQAGSLEELCNNKNIMIDKVLFLDVPNSVIVKRLSGRRICSQCGEIYNIHENDLKIEGRCSQCQGKLVHRDDDKVETVMERLEVYENETLPLVSYYEKKGVLVRINANQSIEKVTDDVLGHLKKIKKNIERIL